MPIYEYECMACGHRLEAIQKISDEPLKDCPSCQKPQLKKLISAAAFRLKGGGWYETDFKSGKQKNVVDSGSKADSGGKTDTGGKESGGKKDSKPSDSGTKKSETKSASSGEK